MTLEGSLTGTSGNSEVLHWRGGTGAFTGQLISGTGTLKLQFSNDGGTTWTDVGSNTTITASGGGVFTLMNCELRVDLSGGSSADWKFAVGPAEVSI